MGCFEGLLWWSRLISLGEIQRKRRIWYRHCHCCLLSRGKTRSSRVSVVSDRLSERMNETMPLPEQKTVDFPRLPEVLTRVRNRYSPTTRSPALIRTCRRTLSVWSPKAFERESPRALKPHRLPKHMLEKDIIKILKDDWNKTRKLTLKM